MRSRKPSSTAPSVSRKRDEAEDLAIRFVNTKAWRLRDDPEERLTSPHALLAWLDGNAVKLPGRLTRGTPPAMRGLAGWHATAIALRESIYAILKSRIDGKNPPAASLAFFNDFLSQASPGVGISRAAGGLVWCCATAQVTAHGLLLPVALSAAELMTGPRAGKVRQCQDDRGCGWLFVDESRAQNRRWCSMGDCGNRAKARRHHARSLTAAPKGRRSQRPA